MKIKEALKENPAVAEEMRQFYRQKWISSLSELENNSIKERLITKEFDDGFIVSHMEFNPRLICDFMDSKNVIIEIKEKQGMFFNVISKYLISKEFSTRLQAELDAVVVSIYYYKERSQ